MTEAEAKILQDRVARGKNFLGSTPYKNAPPFEGEIKGFPKDFCDKAKQKNTGLRKSEQLAHIKLVLKAMGIAFVEEATFHPTRKWRFDVAISPLKIAIEYNGVFSAKSRHLTAVGHSGDTDKLNAAQVLGWVVLQYTPLTYKNFANDIEQLIKQKAA